MEIDRRLREFRALQVKETRADTIAHDREEAHQHGEQQAARARLELERMQRKERNDPNTFTTRQDRALQRAISVRDRGTVVVDARITRHNDIGAEKFAVKNVQETFAYEGVKKFKARVMSELLTKISSKEREKTAKQKASRQAHAHTMDDDLQALLTMDRAQMRQGRVKAAEQVLPAEESPKLQGKFEKVFMKHAQDDGQGYLRNQGDAVRGADEGRQATTTEQTAAPPRRKGVSTWNGDVAASGGPRAAKAIPTPEEAPTLLVPPASLALPSWREASTAPVPETPHEGIPLVWENTDPDATFTSVDVPTALVDFGDSVLDDTVDSDDDDDEEDGGGRGSGAAAAAAAVPMVDVISVLRANVRIFQPGEELDRLKQDDDADVGQDALWGKTMKPSEITSQLLAEEAEVSDGGEDGPMLTLTLSPDSRRASSVTGMGGEVDASFNDGADNGTLDMDTTNSSASTNIARHDSMGAYDDMNDVGGLSGAGVAASDQFADFYQDVSFGELPEPEPELGLEPTPSRAKAKAMALAAAKKSETATHITSTSVSEPHDDLDAFMDELGLGGTSGVSSGVHIQMAGQKQTNFEDFFMEEVDDEDDDPDGDEDDLPPPPSDEEDDDKIIAAARHAASARSSQGETVRASVRSSYGEELAGELDELSASWLAKTGRDTSVSEGDSGMSSVPPSPALWDAPSPSPLRKPVGRRGQDPSPRPIRYVERGNASMGTGESAGAGATSSSSAEEPSGGSGGMDLSRDSYGLGASTMSDTDGERSRQAIMAELNNARASLMDIAAMGDNFDDTLDLGDDEPSAAEADSED